MTKNRRPAPDRRIRRISMSSWLPIVFLTGILAGPALAQDKPAPGVDWRTRPPRVFLDGNLYDTDYIRTEISFVEYVRDRKDADIHILSTSLSAGAGTEYQIEFIGLGPFEDLRFALTYFADRLLVQDERRAGFVRILKKGLMPYLSRTSLEDCLDISYERKAAPPPPARDPWNRWIFGLNLNGSASGETYYGSTSLRAGFSVNRTTEAFKLNSSFSGSLNKSRYTIEDEDILTSTRSWRYTALGVKSLGDHWSVGAWAAASSSTYSNVKTSFQIAPALEYNLFPYSQATRKQMTFLYRLTYGQNRYIEETIYDKLREGLLSQSLVVSLEITQPWGSAFASLVGSHYFHDFDLNRASVYGSLSLRVWKGFSFNVSGDVSMIHDQVSIVKGTLTQEDILLRLKQLRTEYSFYISMGISYTFGSSLSRAVNPRFGEIGY